MEGVIAANLAAVRSRIEAAALAAGRAADSVTLVAVSKTHPPVTVSSVRIECRRRKTTPWAARGLSRPHPAPDRAVANR